MRGIGIRFKGVQRRDVEEYCISEGWIKVQLGSKTDRKGQPLTITLKGPVEAWFEAPAPGAQAEEAATGEAARGIGRQPPAASRAASSKALSASIHGRGPVADPRHPPLRLRPWPKARRGRP